MSLKCFSFVVLFLLLLLFRFSVDELEKGRFCLNHFFFVKLDGLRLLFSCQKHQHQLLLFPRFLKSLIGVTVR